MFHNVKAKVEGGALSGVADDLTAPVKTGGVAIAEEPSAVDSGDVVANRPDLFGNTKVVGNLAHDTVDRGNPIKVGGIARTTNPTAVADLDRVNATFDDLGRQVFYPVQVRDLIFTARASTSTLAEVTLFGGTSGSFNDLVALTCANTTGAAVRLDIRDSTSGGVVLTLTQGANTSQELQFLTPRPQNEAGSSWTIQNAGSGDISNTEIIVSALFARNV